MTNSHYKSFSFACFYKIIFKSWEMVVGPDLPKSEFWLCMVPTLMATLAVPFYAIFNHLNWNIWQLIIATFFAFDLFGGAIVNVTQTTHR